ncbi:MAG: hypothetical protein DCC71_16535 [Proteobacteria bacterium]|nr:MAG: hypothetical protein DCC71_16535 [Pseudomonadota bacterium]
MKWLVAALAILAALVAAAVLFAGALLGGAIERIGADATETPVHVGGVDIAWSEARATLTDVTIGNPAGFESRPAMALGAVTIALEPATLGESPLVLREMQVADLVADVEIREGGETNLAALKRNLEQSAQAGRPGPPRAEPGDVVVEKASRTRMRVEELVVGEGRARVRAPDLDEGALVTVPLGAVNLDDVGGAAGQEPDALVRTIALALVESTARTVAESAVRETLGDEGLGGALRDAVDGAIEEGREALEELQGR